MRYENNFTASKTWKQPKFSTCTAGQRVKFTFYFAVVIEMQSKKYIHLSNVVVIFYKFTTQVKCKFSETLLKYSIEVNLLYWTPQSSLIWVILSTGQ